MDSERLQQEKQIIDHYMKGNTKSYAFGDLYTSKPYLRIAARTNNDKPYVMRIEFPNYPYQKPNAYVECVLRDCHGKLMNSPSNANHTNEAHPVYGWTQMCHYHPKAWTTGLTLWQVYVRCVLWLNIYEETLRTGRNMEYYLRHMGDNGERIG